MGQSSFDRLARLLGGQTSRRAGLGGVLGAVLGVVGLEPTAEAGAKATGKGTGKGTGRGTGTGKPGAEGPCGDGSRKDNACTKDTQCCTGICKKGLKNKDGKGRCRCLRRGKPCTEDRNCCRGVCADGVCGQSGPSAIPTGQPCDPQTDTCADSAATCTAYYQGNPSGTYCLLPNGAACAASTDCGSADCAGGVCVAEVCAVCSTCPYQTVQAAIDAAGAGSVIKIAGGDYAEDLTVGDTSLELTNCNGEAVTLRNVGFDAHTITLDDSTSPPTLTIRNLTITRDTGSSNYGGGIIATGVAFLTLAGTTLITGCDGDTYAGGVHFADGPSTITMQDFAQISDCTTKSDGGGIYLEKGLLHMKDNASIKNNTADGSSYGGGGATLYYEAWMKMEGNAEVSGNTSKSYGGGISFYGYGPVDPNLYSLELLGNAKVINNTASSAGGGVYFDDSDPMLIADNAQVTGNHSDDTGGGMYAAELTKTGGVVENNTPDQCASGSGDAPCA